MAQKREDRRHEAARLDGVDVAPGVLETIVMLAVAGVEGVANVDGQGLAGLVQKASGGRAVEVAQGDDGAFVVTVHLSLRYGQPLRKIAGRVQQAVAEALTSQTSGRVASVDVLVDGVVFPD